MWKDEFEITDFHAHILPGVDDGAPDIETSLAMLEKLGEQGVDKVIATSHYYNFSEDAESFLRRRDESLFRLETYIKEHDLYLPEIVPGAEVRMYPDLWKEEHLEKLCIGESKYILIEMPYDVWSDWMYREIYSLTAKGYTPIMAHLERYTDRIPPKEIITKLLPMDVYVQVNATSFEERKKRKFFKKLIKGGEVVVLGSDCHNLSSRKSNMDHAMKYISRKYTDNCLRTMMETASFITAERR